jgi:hypothetical protein
MKVPLNIVYPEVQIKTQLISRKFVCTIRTNLRMQDTDGLWYLTGIVSLNSSIRSFNEVDVSSLIKTFHRSVYQYQILGIVQKDLKNNITEDYVFILDSDQRDEKTRVQEYYFGANQKRIE